MKAKRAPVDNNARPTSRLETAEKSKPSGVKSPTPKSSKKNEKPITQTSIENVEQSYAGLKEITKEMAEQWKDVKQLDLRNNKLTEMSNLSHCSKLTVLKLNGNEIKEITGLQNCVHLQELHLQGNELISISGIQAPKRLRYLDLSSNNLTKMENLSFALHLTVLDLSYNHIVEIQGLESLQKLEELHLNCNELESLMGLRQVKLEQLKELSLTNNKITSLKGLNSTMSNLQILWLDHNAIPSLHAIPTLPLLRELHVSHNKLTRLTLQTDTTLIAKKFPKLDLIDIRKNELEDVDEIIESLKDCEELSALLLEGNPLCIHLGYELKVVDNLPNLRLLDGTIVPIRQSTLQETWKSPLQAFLTELGIDEDEETGDDVSSVGTAEPEDEIEEPIVLAREESPPSPKKEESKKEAPPSNHIKIPTVDEAREMYRVWQRENQKWTRRREETLNRLKEMKESFERRQTDVWSGSPKTPDSRTSTPDSMNERQVLDLMRSSLTSSSGRIRDDSSTVSEREALDLMRSSLMSSSGKSTGKLSLLREAQVFSKVYDSATIEKDSKTELDRQLKLLIDVKTAQKRGPPAEDHKGYRKFVTPRQRSESSLGSRPGSASLTPEAKSLDYDNDVVASQ